MQVFSNRYKWLPIIASTTWCITLLVLLFTWLGQGRPHYVSQDANFPWISDIGADILKPFFIIGCCSTAISFFLTVFAERWLRHRGRLPRNTRKSQKVLAVLAILGAFMGGSGLVLLSIFDTRRHKNLHRLFLGIFMLGLALSALFTTIEFMLLHKHKGTESRDLKISYMAKAIIVTTLVAAAAAFAVCLGTSQTDAAAYLEWIIAFGFILYPLSFWLDLRLTQPRMVGYPTEGEARSSGDVYGASIRTLRPQQMTEV